MSGYVLPTPGPLMMSNLFSNSAIWGAIGSGAHGGGKAPTKETDKGSSDSAKLFMMWL